MLSLGCLCIGAALSSEEISLLLSALEAKGQRALRSFSELLWAGCRRPWATMPRTAGATSAPGSGRRPWRRRSVVTAVTAAHLSKHPHPAGQVIVAILEAQRMLAPQDSLLRQQRAG